MSYKWVITLSTVSSEEKGIQNFHPRSELLKKSEVSKSGARALSCQQKKEWSFALWRAYDDDNNLLYEGKSLLSGDATGFEPLDDFCQPNAGATRIEIKESNKTWTTL
jgi:hypothetical protein